MKASAIPVSRRTFLSLVGAAAAAPAIGRAQARSGRVALYASVGAELTHYEVDVDNAALTPRGTTTLPAAVQYAWPHQSRRFLYVASSSTASGLGATPGKSHHVTAFRIDASGALSPHGNPIVLPSRPIHLTSDIPSQHLLVAFNDPSAVRVYRVNGDATLGEEVRQPQPIDAGIYGHQVRVTADNRAVILVTRGNDAAPGRPEDPGALKVFSYAAGLLTREASVAPNGGYGFGPRHLDFHPAKPWVYVSLERQNALMLYKMEGDRMNPVAAFRKDTLSAPAPGLRQVAGTVHVHPNGRFVYGVNRADGATEIEGKRVFAGGENTLAVFAIDQSTGEPSAIQHVDTHGIHCRTFHIDPTGRLLVAAHILPLSVKEGSAIRNVPACLSVFRIGADGKLAFVRKYDVEVGRNQMFWMGMVPAAT